MSKINPLLSIIVPVYNTEDSLHRCIDSIITQNLDNVEIILVNDASPSCASLCLDEYKNRLKEKFKIINHNENQGLFHSRITGVQNSSGEYILNVDSDDWLSENSLEQIISILEMKKPDILEFNYSYVNKEINDKYYETPSDYTLQKRRQEESQMVLIERVLCGDINHRIWNKVIRRKMFQEILNQLPQNRRINIAEDLIFISTLYFNKVTYIYSTIKGYYYFQHQDSLTGKVFNKSELIKRFEEDIFSLNYITKLLLKEDYSEDLLDDYKIRICKTIIKNALKFSLVEKKEIFKKLDEQYGYLSLIAFSMENEAFNKNSIQNSKNKYLKIVISKIFPSLFLEFKNRNKTQIKEPYL